MPITQTNHSHVDQLLTRLQSARSDSRKLIFLDPKGDLDLVNAFRICSLGSSFVVGPARVGKTTLHQRREFVQREGAHGFLNKIPYRQKPLGFLVDGTVQPAAACLDLREGSRNV